ncbi:hypothetical protein [Paenibacillus chitinolyticus]|nr:hypothetical protein [Paenibacillus chitinolyticus]
MKRAVNGCRRAKKPAEPAAGFQGLAGRIKQTKTFRVCLNER